MWNLFDVVAVIFVIFYFISPSTGLPSEDEIESQQLRQTFNKLLYELIDMNQQRLNAINRVLELDDRPLTLRSSGEADEALDNNPLILYLVRQSDKNDIDKYNNERYLTNSIRSCLRSHGLRYLSDTHEDGLDIATPDDDINVLNVLNTKAAERTGVLRGWSACKKSAAHACKKACKAAAKNVCSEYSCSRRLKKVFCKECKVNCRDQFS